MINSVGLNKFNNVNNTQTSRNDTFVVSATPNLNIPVTARVNKNNVSAINAPATRLQSEEETKMYNEILNIFATSDTEKISPQDNILRQKKLDALLKKGVLLDKNSNDKTSVLENIYKAIKNERAANISGVKIAGQIIDTLYNPAIITQKFGDIPKEAQAFIGGKDFAPVELDGSNTCAVASLEFHMANKLPAEFARWAESLSSPKLSVEKNVKLSALSKNPMDAIWIINQFGIKPSDFNFNNFNFTVKPDDNAVTRAQIQDNYWDYGERSILDVLFQSSLMQLVSAQTYDTLTDRRSDSEDQGLIEYEKTFLESIVENRERNLAVYQNLAAGPSLAGWNCSFDEIKKDITDAIDSNQDVVIGYTLTASDCNEIKDDPNEIVGGHEITIVDYKKDENGKVTFVCNDTDDNIPGYVEYSEEYLLPKIHHASYLANN